MDSVARWGMKASLLFLFGVLLVSSLSMAFFPDAMSNALLGAMDLGRASVKDLGALLGVYAISVVLAWWFFPVFQRKSRIVEPWLMRGAFVVILETAWTMLFGLQPDYDAFSNTLFSQLGLGFLTTGALDWVFSLGFIVFKAIVIVWLMDFFERGEKPSKSSTESTGVRRAGFKRRLAAYAIDVSILSAIILGLTIAIGLAVYKTPFDATGLDPKTALVLGLAPWAVLWMLVGLVVGSAYWVIVEGTWSTTIGKKLLGLVVRKENGDRASWGNAFFRNAPKFVGGLDLGLWIDLAWMLMHDDRRRLFDEVAETMVVRMPETSGTKGLSGPGALEGVSQ